MKNETLFTGYKSDFLQTGKNVEMPILSEDQDRSCSSRWKSRWNCQLY